MAEKKKSKAAKRKPEVAKPIKFKPNEEVTTVTEMATGEVLAVIDNKEKFKLKKKVPDGVALAKDQTERKLSSVNDLDKLETQIAEEGRKSLRSYLNVGEALSKIEKNKLYKGKYRNFGEYCRTRWGYGKTYGYDIVGAYKVYTNLSAIAETEKIDEIFTNESQLRPLKKLENDGDRLLVLNKLIEKTKDIPLTSEIVKNEIACFNPKTKEFTDKPILKRALYTPSVNKISLKGTDIETTATGISFTKLDDEKIKIFQKIISTVLMEGGSIDIICKPKKAKKIVKKKVPTKKKTENNTV